MPTHEPLSVGVFDDLDKAQETIDELRRHGFQSDEIGIIGHIDDEQPVPTPLGMKAPEQNAMHSVSVGGLFGALIGALVILIIPGVAAVTELGRWVEIVGGAILGGAIGGVLSAYRSFFLSLAQGRIYERELEKGRFIVTVKSPHRLREALNVINRRAVHSETESV